MAAALYPSATDSGPGIHAGAYSRSLMTDYDFRDGRYPTLPSQSTSKGTTRTSPVLLGTQNMAAWEKEAQEDDEYFKQRPVNGDPSTTEKSSSSQDWSLPEQRPSPSNRTAQPPVISEAGPSSVPYNQTQDQPRNAVSYSLPQGAPRRVVERYSLENNDRPQTPSQTLPDGSSAPEGTARINPPQSHRPPDLTLPSAPRHPSLPTAGIGANSNMQNGSASPSFMPLSASPTYSPPVSTRQRAYPQQPTYINNVSPTPVYLPKNPPAEEVCIECAMRDQDMADVNVTSPGVWDRESDIHYEELKRREGEEEATGVVNTDVPPRPRAYGGKLTEQNLKLWLSVNPREPTSRQQTLNSFVKSQRALLDAQAAAHNRAMREARQLDDRMRDAYSQLRRSAYDTGNSAAPADDTGGIRIKPPSSPTSPAFGSTHERTHSRDVTLLENGMIVEHVDVRKEEREVRSKQRREERRARKSSRSSAIDATSLVSTQSLVLPTSHTDNGIGLSPYSRLSQASTVPRPMSVFTGFGDRPDIPRAYSQASFSDMQSLGSPSPRRSRFFGGLRSSGWLSQDSLAPSGMSGSMIDMHVALQRDADRKYSMASPIDMNRNSNYWPAVEIQSTASQQSSQDKKKKKGLAKIWQIVTRSKDKSRPQETSDSTVKVEDDFPLAPPPPLSYLVDRIHGERHAASSTASLPSTVPPKFGLTTSVSPPTAPSSSIPSPTSSRQSGADQDTVSPEDKQINGQTLAVDTWQPESGRRSPKGVHSALSEPDLRGRISPRPPSSPPPPLPNNGRLTPLTLSPASREKSLPPLPGEVAPRPNANLSDTRPQTFYTYDSRLPPGALPNHDFLPPNAPFREAGARRQSFSGLTSRPKFDSILGKTTGSPARPLTTNYDEFGSSRRSLGLKDLISPMRNTVSGPTKRKSRFGLASLLGRKSPGPEKELKKETYIPTPTVYSDGPEDVLTGYAASSRHSVLSSNTGGPAPGLRMSVASRKGLGELVAQDTEFVAYRYPSQDQRLEMLTR